MDGDASQAAGPVVVDLDDVDQVAKLYPGPGLSFRGGGADWWRERETYVEPGWLRTSRDPQVATGNFAVPAVVAVLGATGRDLATASDHPGEQETVFLPGSRFTVLVRGDWDGTDLTIVRVHADGSDPDADADGPDDDEGATIRRVTAVLARARTLPPVEITRPGRFSGEFGVRR